MADGWVKVARFAASDAHLEATMLVQRLAMAGIPAVRLPSEPASAFGAGSMVAPVVVLVPQDQADAAKAVIADEQADDAETATRD